MTHEHDTETETETAKGRKVAMLSILRTLRAVVKRHEAGEPVYAEMAARIQGREHEAADDLIREALEG